MPYFEPISGEGAERRDAFGATGPHRSQPHRGADWGFKNGSHRKVVTAVHDGIVTQVVYFTGMGWSVIVRNINGHEHLYLEYNHFDERPRLKRGDKVVGGDTMVGLIGASGTQIQSSTAYHVHIAISTQPVPHKAARATLKDPFRLIDEFKPKAKPKAKTTRKKAAK